MRFSPFFIIIFFIWTCKSQDYHQPALLQLSDDQKIIFLDSMNASIAIITDTIEYFFDQINSLDMSIQLKKKMSPAIDKTTLLAEYKTDLQEDVLTFSPEEISFIKNIFYDIYKDCNIISKDVFPKEIKLIKIQGSHYGEGAFYTRENCIIIPQSELKNPEKESFRKTMLHELFHIYSRLNPQKKVELYGLIGFKSTGGVSLLQIDRVLKEKIILNPDGINYAYSIQLKAEDQTTFKAIPLIISNENSFQKEKPGFFDYLEFGLYKIIPPFSRMIKVVSDSNGKSLNDFKNHPEFFEQITDNTDYIIHPDELMADNFVIAIQSLKDASVLDKLSDPGKDLIKKVLEVINN